MAIHKPGIGDYADRLTVLLLKLEKTLSGHVLDEAKHKSVTLWLEELHECTKGAVSVPVDHIFRLSRINRTIWQNEDLVREWIRGEIPADKDVPFQREREITLLTTKTTKLNDERASIVALLNGVADKVGRT